MQKSYVHRQECQNGGSRILTFLSSVKLCLNVNRDKLQDDMSFNWVKRVENDGPVPSSFS